MPSAADAPSLARTLRHRDKRWLSFELDLARVELALLGQRAGEPQSLAGLEPFLAARGRSLAAATNAGIFDPERRPLGLHIEDGQELAPLSLADGEGNFYLKPNGVFWLDSEGAHVAPSEDYAPRPPVQLATQSGPLLLRAGRVHPAFDERGTSLRVRSAVGVNANGHVFLALSLEPVSFYETASLFRDLLGCPDALYLDGEISALVGPGIAAQRIHQYAGLLVATWRRAER